MGKRWGHGACYRAVFYMDGSICICTQRVHPLMRLGINGLSLTGDIPIPENERRMDEGENLIMTWRNQVNKNQENSVYRF